MTTLDASIQTHGLAKHYGDVVALDALNLEVPSGVVFGFLGPNGAGKSTLIRMLVGLSRPTAGTATVLGHDIVDARVEIHRRIGYLPGDQAVYPDLTPRQQLDHLANLRGGVDPAHVTELVERFALPMDRPIGNLSHGNKRKVGIVAAFMHRPPVVILDEPTQGLDPLMQRSFIELVRSHRDAGNTVFLSSHILSEVQALADQVAIVRQGRLVVTLDAGELRSTARHHVELTFMPDTSVKPDTLAALASVSDVTEVGTTVHLTVDGSMDELLRTVAPLGVDRIVSRELDLEELFLGYYGASEG